MADWPRGAPARRLRWAQWWPPLAVGALMPLMCGGALADEEAAREACSFEQATYPLRGFSDHEVEFSGMKRRYVLYAPRNQGGLGHRQPLLILAPDDGLSPQEQVRMAGLVVEAEKGSFAFVALEGLHTEAGVVVDGAAYAEAVLSEVARLLCLDAGRISCASFGAGGAFCATAASELRGAVAAIAPVAGLGYPEPNYAGDPVSVLAFHGLKDPVRPFEGHEGLQSVPDAAEAWAKFNSCTNTAQEVLQDGVTVVRHTGCRQGTSVVVVIADEGGHTWPGSDYSFGDDAGPSLADFSATTMIAEFLRQLPQRAPLSQRAWKPAGARPPALMAGRLLGWALLGALAGAVGFYALVVVRQHALQARGSGSVPSKGGYYSVPTVAGLLDQVRGLLPAQPPLFRAVSPERGAALAAAAGESSELARATRAAAPSTAQSGDAANLRTVDIFVQRGDTSRGSASRSTSRPLTFLPTRRPASPRSRNWSQFSPRAGGHQAPAAGPPAAMPSSVQFETASEWLSAAGQGQGQWQPGMSGEVKVW